VGPLDGWSKGGPHDRHHRGDRAHQALRRRPGFTVVSNAVRSLTLGGADAAGRGHSTAYWVVLSLAWYGGILAALSAVAVSRFARPS